MIINHVCLTGTLGKNPETKQSGYNSFYISSLAHTAKKKDGSQQTTWVDLLCFGDAAKMIAGLSKGDQVFVCGKLSVKQDEKYKNVTIMCDVVQKIPKKEQPQQPPMEQFTNASSHIDDVPF